MWRRIGGLLVGLAALVAAAAILGFGAPTTSSIQTAANANSGPMATAGPQRDGGFGGPGGHDGPPGFAKTDDVALGKLLDGVDNRWAAASVGSMMVSDLELRTSASLMAIGPFTGGDNSPTLAQFQQYVADGQVRYLFERAKGGWGGPPHSSDGSAAEVTAWVKENFAPSQNGGVTVYDLQAPRRADG